MKQFNMGNSFEQNMPSKIKNEPFWDLGRPTIVSTHKFVQTVVHFCHLLVNKLN